MQQPRKIQTIDIPIIVLVGPTAIGKTALSFELVDRFDCEIISMDSMQVYRHMDIGTAKPGRAELASVPHHLIDILDPDEQYDAARFVHDCLEAIENIGRRGRAVLLTGGTGLYLKALIEGLFDALPTSKDVREQLRRRLADEGRETLHAELCRLDPKTGARVHKNDTQRLLRGLELHQLTGKTWSELLAKQKEGGSRVHFTRMYQVGLTCERQKLYTRIEQRSRIMIQQGLIEEVERLLAMGYSRELPSMQSIGYRHANNYIAGEWSHDEMMALLIRDTRRYAKRQMTWFGRNTALHWFDPEDSTAVADKIAKNIFS
jgi:tRNA dimethylallyltransferase